MGKPLNIRNPRAHELAQELADRRKTGITEAVIVALENELRREAEAVPLAERLLAIAERARTKSETVGPPLTDEERDAMWTRF
jgi:antitoxin VapB